MTIYQKIKHIAAKVVEHYKEDVTVHDLRLCNGMVPGNVAIWCPRQCGSHFTWLNHAEDAVDADTLESLRLRLNYWDAVDSTHDNVQWYVLECVGKKRHGHVFSIDTAKARQMFVDKINAVSAEMDRTARAIMPITYGKYY